MMGVGARLYGGRWNSPGHDAIYTSGNLTLAMLEVLVHVDDAEAFGRIPYVFHAVSFADIAVATLASADLPANWNARPEAGATQVAGDEWLESLITPVLAVPSVIIPPELRYDPAYLNYVINPKHPDFATRVVPGSIHDLVWDPRFLVRASEPRSGQ